MRSGQLNIDFTVNHQENRSFNRKRLDENRDYFSAQCQQVFGLLMSGVGLTVLNAHVEYQISSLPRRSKDLSDKGVKITKTYQNRICTYSMTELDRKFNRENFKK
jgi:hypothetical protein